MSYSENHILTLLKKESSKAYGFNLLVNEYKERIYWVIRRIVISHENADDVVQEAFIKAWLNIDSFQGSSKIYTWLYRIAVNESLSFLRKKRTKLFLPIVDVERQLSAIVDDITQFDGDEIERRLQKALLKLPEKQRVVFTIRYHEDLKFSELATILEMSEGGVKSTYHLAVKKLKDFLQND